MKNNNHKIFAFPLFSLTLFFFGIALIISSVVNFFSLEDYISSQIVEQLPSKLNVQEDNFILASNINNKINKTLVTKFVLREDLSIKGLSSNFASLEKNKKNTLSTDQLISLRSLNNETAILNKEILDSNLQ